MTGPASPRRARELLAPLARLHGLQASYRSAAGERVQASRETLLAGLRAAGAPVDRLEDVPGAHRARLSERWSRIVEPVVVAWNGRLRGVGVRLPASLAGRPIDWSVELEGAGETLRGRVRGDDVGRAVRGREDVDGGRFVEALLPVDVRLPLGYHRLRIEAGAAEGEALLLAAPVRPGPHDGGRAWGVFLPLYALTRERPKPVADLTDLRELLEWVAGLGGSFVATLPLLAAFLEEPFEPSPYSPASRLFWNELYLDVDEAGRAIGGPRDRRPARRGRRRREDDLVDYREAMTAKRRRLEPLVARLFEDGGEAARRLRAWARTNGRAEDYAAFRAACRRHRRWWGEWPARERDGRLPRHGGDEGEYRFHLAAQWLAAEQLGEADRTAAEAGAGLYFDLPVGVNAAGYDVWRERAAFVLDASAGAPPDPFFSGGQDWGFPPLHPDGIREQGYRYFVDCIRHLCRHASVLRIDHVMGLHRLYWIPRGVDPGHGLYARYRAEELYAILCLEAHRNGVTIVGEDLGTVPEYVRRALGRHGMLRSYVLQFEVSPDPDAAIRPPRRHVMAGLNTHDLPPFAAFWRGGDIRARVEQGWQGAEAAEREEAERTRIRRAVLRFLRSAGLLRGLPPVGLGNEGAAEAAALRAALRYLAGSEARMVVVNLEDLWLDPRPQNTPGTSGEHPNWRRRAAHPFETLREMPDVLGTLAEVNRLRRGEPEPASPRGERERASRRGRRASRGARAG